MLRLLMNMHADEPLDPLELIEKPEFYLWRFDGPNTIFARMTRETYKQSIFTDERIVAAHPKPLRIDTDRLAQAFRGMERKPPRLCFIFHVAHCGSTLLAKALDIESKSLVYREPLALRQLAVIRVENNWLDSPPPMWSEALEMTAHILSKSYQPGLPPIIKANVPVNFILHELMDIAPDSSGVLLYSTFENYLLSILKTDNHRQWVNSVSATLSPLIDSKLGIAPGQRRDFSTAECAASLWLAQLLAFKDITEKYPGLKTLDSELFFSRPRDVLAAAFDLFSVAVSDPEVDQIVNSDLFNTHAKMPGQDYSNQQRLEEKTSLIQSLKNELDQAWRWLQPEIEARGLPQNMPNPLHDESPDLWQSKAVVPAVPPTGNWPYACIEASNDSSRLEDINDARVINALKKQGALLIRGYEYELENFTTFVQRFCTSSAFNPSLGRETVDPENNIQTVDLGVDAFPLHAELCREPWKPDVCFFACESAPSAGGETTLCDGVKIVEALSEETIQQLQSQPLKYYQPMQEEDCRKWLGSEKPDPELIKNPPSTIPFEMTYLDGQLCRIHITNALHLSMFSEELAFGNFLLFSRYGLNNRLQPCFADGSIVPDEAVEKVKEVSDKLTFAHKWQTGDLLMLDNTRFLHGRRKILNIEERRILSYFGYLKFARLSPAEANRPWRTG